MAVSAASPALAQAALMVLKSTLLLGAAALGAHALRRASAATRHLVWSLALAGMAALPAFALLLPRWKPAALAVLRPAIDAGGTWAADAGPPRLSPEMVLLAVWAAGTVAVLARLIGGLLAVRHLARGAERVDDPAWTALLERLGRAVGVRRGVTLLRSPHAAMPLTWGALRPTILLPACADGWTPERRRVVLLHELAHVARRDCLMQTLAEACCAVWWFHPGAWWAAKRMRVEREQACDDQVLAAGARASDYAGHLLDVARAYRAPALAAAIAMARPSHLEGRVRAVLAPERDRRGVTGRTAALCAGAVLLASLPLAAVSPSERPLAPQAVAWQMPPARTPQRPGIHGHMTVRKPVEAAPARVAAAPVTPRTESTTPSESRHPKSAVQLAERTAKSPHVAERGVKPTQTQARHGHGRARVESPSVLASLDADGNVHARVRLPRGMNVRVEGHGVRSSENEIRVDFNVLRTISQLSRASTARGKRQDLPRKEPLKRHARIANEVRRELLRDKHDLALHILSGVNGDTEDGDADASHACKTPMADERAGGA